MSDNENSKGSTGGAVVGGAAGAIMGTNIAIGVAAATGGIGAIFAPEIIGFCTYLGASRGYENPKANTYGAMGAGGTVAGWLGQIFGS
jgi:hypothetical protein